jgi:hypothetical protein
MLGNKPLVIDIHNEYGMEHHVWLFHIAISDVGKVSSGFEYFGKIFAHQLVPNKIMIVPDRESNILSNTYLSKKTYLEKRLKYSKNYFCGTHIFYEGKYRV